MNVIQIENLWKEYRLGVIGHGTLTHDLQSWWARKTGKDDPNVRINPTQKKKEKQITGDRFWALQDINLEIKQGEVLGIIGNNGAGKSTLLKILSRVTAPSKGNIKIKGHIASLLEVGTGFHPELTGRENIYLNGAILGMSRQEVKCKFDEIVDFSGIEPFIDTPVKRYSSGMYVRLAFAVAAHLEPEILIIDEVLAVGDADFQKKCLGKMGAVAHEGRTVLFVSHNMGAVSKLCNKGVFLEDGTVKEYGDAEDIIKRYLCGSSDNISRKTWGPEIAPGNNDIKLNSIEIIVDNNHTNSIFTGQKFAIQIAVDVHKEYAEFGIQIVIRNSLGQSVIHSSSIVSIEKNINAGSWIYQVEIAANLLREGEYFISIRADIPNKEWIFFIDNVLRFSLVSKSTNISIYSSKLWTGVLSPEVVKWSRAISNL